MTKLFISQPMRGRRMADIVRERKTLVADAAVALQEDEIAVLDTLFDGGGVYANQMGDSHKGMGIGLSLCKTIINAHGGQIRAGNHQNGAQFTFTLPDWREY